METPPTPTGTADQRIATAQAVACSDLVARAEREATRIHQELFDLANSLGGDDTGFIAVTLHGAANRVNDARSYLQERVKRATLRVSYPARN